MNRKQHTTAIIMILSIAVFHFFIPREYLSIHVLFRMLYLVPIVYIALYSGRKGGVIGAAIVTIIYLPHFFMAKITHEFLAGNIALLVLFPIAGFFVGSFRDSTERSAINKQQRNVVLPSTGVGCKILFYIDKSPLSAAAAEWFGTYFGCSDLTITLLSVINEDASAKFASQELADEYVAQQRKETSAFLDKIRDVLIETAIPPESIVAKNIAVMGKVSVSDKILEELKNGGYDLVLLAKHNQAKAQEFLFGDVSIRLLREASIPVLSVKGTSEEFHN